VTLFFYLKTTNKASMINFHYAALYWMAITADEIAELIYCHRAGVVVSIPPSANSFVLMNIIKA
jgi:hypothetical protein